MSTIVAERPSPTADLPAPRSALVTLVGRASMAVAAAPFALVGLWYAFSGELVLGGDHALVALDAFDAGRLEQFVGSYSRMGWAHPGPTWAYLLAPVYALFGSTGQGLVAASMLIHGLFAALVVAAVGSERAWQRPLAAGLVLLYTLRMPSLDLVLVWNPLAALLPTLLLLLLAARACAGSAAAFAASLLVGSFLLQLHVGTAPLVGVVTLVSAVGLAARMARTPSVRPDRRAWRGIAASVGGLCFVWALPLYQQVTAAAGQGNLTMLARQFLDGGSTDVTTYGWADAVSSVGQMLGATVFGWPANPAPMVTTILTPAIVVGVCVQLAGGVVLAAAGRRLGDRQVQALGMVILAGTVAGLLAAKSVTGDMYNYLILWITVLPAALLYGSLSLLLTWRPSWDGAAGRLAVGLTAGALVGAGVVGGTLERAAERLGDQPGAAAAASLVLEALPSPGPGDAPVLLDVVDGAAWSNATAVALQLEQSGHRISVSETWVYAFGRDRLSTGGESFRIVLMSLPPGATRPPGTLGVVDAATGPEAIVLERLG